MTGLAEKRIISCNVLRLISYKSGQCIKGIVSNFGGCHVAGGNHQQHDGSLHPHIHRGHENVDVRHELVDSCQSIVDTYKWIMRSINFLLLSSNGTPGFVNYMLITGSNAIAADKHTVWYGHIMMSRHSKVLMAHIFMMLLARWCLLDANRTMTRHLAGMSPIIYIMTMT